MASGSMVWSLSLHCMLAVPGQVLLTCCMNVLVQNHDKIAAVVHA